MVKRDGEGQRYEKRDRERNVYDERERKIRRRTRRGKARQQEEYNRQ